jgi:tRNA G18 (ribose-2'-O)-methylase SpoU
MEPQRVIGASPTTARADDAPVSRAPIFIDDADDPRIAPYRAIRERDLVGREGLFIAEGEVVVRVLLTRSLHRPLSLLVAEKRIAAIAALTAGLTADVPVYAASQAVMDEVAGFPMHRGILALGRRGAERDAGSLLAAAGARATVVVLSAIANHDNMGGIFRNAAAFGADAVILDSDCCDPLYRKAIRVSVGAALTVPFARLDRGVDGLALLAANGFEALALTPGGSATLAELTRPERVAVIFGAEGAGLPEAMLARCRTVRIPMAGQLDSLNVATASGIVLHHFAFGKG